MKSLDRSVKWWPGMDMDIDSLAKETSTSCKAMKNTPSYRYTCGCDLSFLGSESTWRCVAIITG